MRVRLFFLFSILGLAFSIPSTAQQVYDGNQNLPPFGSFSGSDFDIVSLQNGNVHIHIPILTVKQRHGTVSRAFVYDTPSFIMTKTVTVVQGKRYVQFTVDRSYSLFGWNLVNEGDSGSGGIHATSIQENCGHGTVGALGLYSVIDPEGIKHPLNLHTGGCFGPITTSPTFDGSGIMVDIGQTPNLITLKDGTQIQVDTQREDTNGNIMTGATDDLGRTLLTITDGPTTTYTSPLGKTASEPAYTNWTVKDSNGNSQTYRIDYALIDLNTSFCTTTYAWACTNYTFGAFFPAKLTLPNAKFYQFNWVNASAAELQSIILPTGASISYTYTNLCITSPSSDVQDCRRGVQSRTVTQNGASSTWNYSIFPGYYATETDPLGNDTVHTFGPVVATDGFSGSLNTVETQLSQYSGSASSGLLLRKTVKDYTGEDANPVVNNARLIRETTTLDNGLVAKTETDYELISNSQFSTFTRLNPTEKREYDYASGAPGPLLRRTDYTYLHQNNSTYNNLNIVDRPTSVIVYNGSGSIVSQTQYEYDVYNHSGMPAMAATGAVQHDSARGTGYTTRGNVTATSQWRNTDGAFLTTTNQYDDAGNVIATKDPIGNLTQFDYTDAWSNATCAPSGQGKAYVTKTTNALNQITTKIFASCTGLNTSVTDPNLKTTSSTYDLLSRPVSVSFPDGGQTANCYTDVGGSTCQQSGPPFSALTTTIITSALNKTSTNVFDGLGRPTQSQFTSDPQGSVFTDITYDALGRIATVSNPYRSSSDPTYGITTTQYDALSRVTKGIPQDGSTPVLTTYSGNCTTVTDQAAKSRKSCSDALGRLTQVFEDPSGLNYETDYAYDTLDNLLTVNQKGGSTNSANWRTRTFTYNSLSQLLTASNPESGTITYTYDNVGNLLTKTAPAPNQTGTATVVTTYSYDPLNRLNQKSYNDGATATVKYGYDGVAPTGCTPPTLTITNGIGRRTSMCDAAGAEAWSYDTMGRPLADSRTANAITKSTTYTYNPDGSLATLTYPSGRVITYSYNAAAHLTSAVDVPNSINYATAATYAPQGALASLQNGGSIVSTMYFNTRLQPCRISVKNTGTAPVSCTDTASGNVLDFTYGFSLGTADNGSVASITNNRDTTRSPSFTYDALNRLLTAKTSSTSGANCWDESLGYDPWANLLSIGRISGYTCSNEELLNVTATTKNQISGDTYDAAGNLINDGLGHAYTYNAENQLLAAAGVTYTYDGDGKRAQKSNGKLYWYGMGSDTLDETDLTGSTTNTSFKEYIFFGGRRVARRDSSNNVNYYFADHLGTARIVANSSGAVLDDSDFYPFGGERPITSSSGNSYKFTGKERDSESGLDNFGARYYSSSLGRFETIDPIVISAERMIDPQQLNAYSYARGNPLRFVDPDGQEVRLSDLSEEDRKKLIEQLQKQTGLTLQYNSKSGDLDVVGDPSKASGGSATFRQGLLTAINSKDVYNVLDRNEYRGETVDTGLYDRQNKTLVLNFNNISGVEANHPDDVNLGTTFYHELIGHGVEGLPDTREFRFWLPTAVDRENQVRKELGMYQRSGWEPTKCENGTCTIMLYKNLNNGKTDWHFVDIPLADKKKQ